MRRLTRDGTAEPVSRDQVVSHARGQGNIIFPVQLTTSTIGNLTRLIHTLLCVYSQCSHQKPLIAQEVYLLSGYFLTLHDIQSDFHHIVPA